MANSIAAVEAGVDASGELPDHLIPVLRYLGWASDPLPELVAVFEPAVRRMLQALREGSSRPLSVTLQGDAARLAQLAQADAPAAGGLIPS